MNSLEQYISDLNPSCWYRSDATNGYGIANPANGANITNFKNIAQVGVFDGVFDIVGSNPPKYVEGGINGLPYLEFLSANSNVIRVPTLTNPYGIDARSIVLVVSSIVSGSYLFQHDFGGVVNGNISITSWMIAQTYQSLASLVGQVYSPRDLKVVIYSQKNGGFYNLFNINHRFNFINTTCTVNPSNTSVEGSTLTNGFSLGARFNSSTNPPVANTVYASFRFYEAIIFDKQLSSEQVAQLQTYLKLKYNI